MTIFKIEYQESGGSFEFVFNIFLIICLIAITLCKSVQKFIEKFAFMLLLFKYLK